MAKVVFFVSKLSAVENENLHDKENKLEMYIDIYSIFKSKVKRMLYYRFKRMLKLKFI